MIWGSQLWPLPDVKGCRFKATVTRLQLLLACCLCNIQGIEFIECWEMHVFELCRIHLVAGCVGDDSNVEECEETYISNVQYAADMAKPVTILLRCTY